MVCPLINQPGGIDLCTPQQQAWGNQKNSKKIFCAIPHETLQPW
jgi:hypothetical protein